MSILEKAVAVGFTINFKKAISTASQNSISVATSDQDVLEGVYRFNE